MKIQHKYFILIICIVFAVSLPPILCYKYFVLPSDNKTSGDYIVSESPSSANSDDPASQKGQDNFVILIDPGHGGFDPGKVSPDGIEEKKVNLDIALKLRDDLTSKGFSVFMTRDTDCSLNTPDAQSKKTSDLLCRTTKASELCADLYISIHQNSYSAEYVHGAQVFYYSTSSAGKSLAESVQNQLINDVDPSNTRKPKGNTDYLVLTESPCTAIIVECGFLSNTAECQKLCDSNYQAKLANAIADAISSWHDSNIKKVLP